MNRKNFEFSPYESLWSNLFPTYEKIENWVLIAKLIEAVSATPQAPQTAPNEKTWEKAENWLIVVIKYKNPINIDPNMPTDKIEIWATNLGFEKSKNGWQTLEDICL